MTEPLQAALFDFAGVMTEPFLGRSGRDQAPQTEAERQMRKGLWELLSGVTFGASDDHPWHRLETGRMELAEFVAWVDEQVPGGGARFDPQQGEIPLSHLPMRTALIDEVRRLREAGVRTALVTNNVREWRPVWSSRLPLDELFDTVVDSSEVGHRKPEAEIYELTLGRLEVTADRAVFLDDMTANVEGARAVGLHAIHVEEDTDAVIAELRTLTGR
ncbi:MAG: HAD family phosphatase [Actinomycetia bacterium]|nr:HAD family phosphatase [Actinomycetes bacterium]